MKELGPLGGGCAPGAPPGSTNVYKQNILNLVNIISHEETESLAKEIIPKTAAEG